jgi:hypothetical protein
MGIIYVAFLTAGKGAVAINAQMRPDRAVPHPEMVNAGIERLSEGTILLTDGYGPGDGGRLRGEEDGLPVGVLSFLPVSVKTNIDDAVAAKFHRS